MNNISIELQGLIERLQAKERSKCCQGWLRIIQEKLAEGVLRVVEIGDGQVSDLVGWSIYRFVRMMLEGLGDYVE